MLVYLLQAGKRNCFTSCSQNLGRDFLEVPCTTKLIDNHLNFGRAQNDEDQEARVDFGAVLELLKNDGEGEGGEADNNEDTGSQFSIFVCILT